MVAQPTDIMRSGDRTNNAFFFRGRVRKVGEQRGRDFFGKLREVAISKD